MDAVISLTSQAAHTQENPQQYGELQSARQKYEPARLDSDWHLLLSA